jgi:hypothetical protein
MTGLPGEALGKAVDAYPPASKRGDISREETGIEVEFKISSIALGQRSGRTPHHVTQPHPTPFTVLYRDCVLGIGRDAVIGSEGKDNAVAGHQCLE